MDENKQKALAAALGQIEKQFGKGSIMRLVTTKQWTLKPSLLAHSLLISLLVLVVCQWGVSLKFSVLNLLVKRR